MLRRILGASFFATSVFIFCSGFTFSASAAAPTVPSVIAFTMTPDSIDTTSTNPVVSFDLTVSNPTGIQSTQTSITLTDGGNNTLSTFAQRTDVPTTKSLQIVKFHGALKIPSNFTSGVYSASAKPIMGQNADGTDGYSTETLYATSKSQLIGGLDSLLVRNSGDLNYDYPTFAGPAFNKRLTSGFVNPKFTTAPDPIWKIGEALNIADYYELNVPSLNLRLKANTPSVCSANALLLNFISGGACSFTVYTDKTYDYQYFKDNQVVMITAARIKPAYSVGTIPTQNSVKLPLSIMGPFIYSPIGVVTPVSATPTVCYPVGTYITVISGGICTLNYSTPATSTYLASDVYPLTFEITRSTQTVAFTTVSSMPAAGKTLSLSATATSGLPITFQSDSPSICSVNGSSLNLRKSGSCVVEAVQSGNATIAPASLAQTILVSSAPAPSKKIVCVKAGKSKVFVGTKCPTGYKVKK